MSRSLVLIAAAVLATDVFAAGTTQPPQAVAVILEAGSINVTFDQCGLIGNENDVVVGITGSGMQFVSPGRFRVGDIVCSRRLTDDETLSEWRQQIENGDYLDARSNGTVRLVAADGSAIVRWTFVNGWPSKLLISQFNETVAITADALVRDGRVTPQITWPAPLAITYGEALSVTQLNASSPVAGSFTYDPPAGSVLPAGVHTLSATFTPSDTTSFNGAAASVQLTVTKAPLSVAADDKTMTYGDEVPSFTYAVTGFVNGDTESVLTGMPLLTSAASHTSSVGDYPIAITLGTLVAANYGFNFDGGTLKVLPAPLTATAFDASRPYGSPNPIFTGSLEGVVNDDRVTATFGTAATERSDVGTYPITPSLSDPDGRLPNYTVTLVDGTLTITKVVLTVTADDKFSIYLDPLPALTARIAGFVLGEDATVLSGAPALSTPALPDSVPGSYPIFAAPGTLTATNYSFQFVNGTLTIGGARTALRMAADRAALLTGQSAAMATEWLVETSALARWTDENRPLSKEGQFVFTRAKDAANKLSDAPALDLIRKACRIIAVVAINDAVAAGADAKVIAKAREDLARGDSLTAAGRLENAILEYRNAWQRFR